MTGESNSRGWNGNRTVIGVLVVALASVIIAMSSFSITAYKRSTENSERIAVSETSIEYMKHTIEEIAADVKELLKRR